MRYRLKLPWPPKELSPNAREHWGKRSKFSKRYKADCFYVAKTKPTPTSFDLTLVFHPPDNRRRDDDNMIASFKAGRDGLAVAWGVDDSVFRFVYEVGAPVKHGRVTVKDRA